MEQLTPSQEDIICEPTKKCEFCKNLFPKDEIVEQKIDNGEVVEICLGCLEDLEDVNNADYKEKFGDDDLTYDRMREEKAIEQYEAEQEKAKTN